MYLDLRYQPPCSDAQRRSLRGCHHSQQHTRNMFINEDKRLTFFCFFTAQSQPCSKECYSLTAAEKNQVISLTV